MFKNPSDAALFTTIYTYTGYTKDSVNYTSAQLASITNGYSTITYTYDPNGNIKTITNSGLVIEYFYDALGQVIRENNQRDNSTVIYGYDFGGNILSKTTYEYTKGSVDGLTPKDTDTYGYTNTNWKDQLTYFNGNAITYDAIGNPLTYQGKTFTWDKGRQLSTITAPGTSISYTYNDSGIRTSKSVNGTTTNYHLSGDKVTYEKTGDVYSYYTYDSNGQLVSLNANGTEYYYIRNGQNDIIRLVDSTGTLVVSYTYSTYGEVISITGSLASTLGASNPYRYRGYRFDTETGYYYLQSRYFDPGMGRFINADGLIASSEAVLGANMYAYCENNPIVHKDPSGFMLMHLDQLESTPGLIERNNVSSINTSLTDSFNFVSNVQTGYRAVLTTIGSFADLSVSGTLALTGCAYAFSTPFTVLAHINDPYLTTEQKIGLSVMEVGFAGGGILLAWAMVNWWNPTGWAAAGIGIAYTFAAWKTSSEVTESLERKNGRVFR